MTRVLLVSGHELTFNLKRIDGGIPRATILITRNRVVPDRYMELSGADVEAVLAVLLRIREKQRGFETARANADESKAPAPSHAPATGKRKPK